MWLRPVVPNGFVYMAKLCAAESDLPHQNGEMRMAVP